MCHGKNVFLWEHLQADRSGACVIARLVCRQTISQSNHARLVDTSPNGSLRHKLNLNGLADKGSHTIHLKGAIQYLLQDIIISKIGHKLNQAATPTASYLPCLFYDFAGKAIPFLVQ